MMKDLSAALLALCVVIAKAAEPRGTACITDDDCQLNGLCNSGVCHCDAAWTGDACQRLNLLPAKIDAGLQLKPRPAKAQDLAQFRSSWGGGVVHQNGTYQMMVSIFEQGCGLNAWLPNSAMGRAVASEPEGPYELVELVKPHFSHSATPVREPETGRWLVFNIGRGDNVSVNTSEHRALITDCDGGCTNGAPWNPGTMFFGPVSVLRSKDASLHGPWEDHLIAECDEVPGCPENGNDMNPAPLIFPNGSAMMMWRPLNWSSKGQSYIALATSPSGALGPWNWDATNIFPGFTDVHIEDEFMWIDTQGHFHALFHSDVELTEGGAAGGHAYSRDGWTWTFSKYNAYGRTVEFRDGASMSLARRERPKLIFDETGRPRYLLNGAQKRNDCDNTMTFVQPICAEAACSGSVGVAI